MMLIVMGSYWLIFSRGKLIGAVGLLMGLFQITLSLIVESRDRNN